MRKTKSSSLYIHIPFCKTICSYCDFCKSIYNETTAIELVSFLTEKIANYDKKFKTIYTGGGTPSCLPINLLEKLLISCKNKLDQNYEFTVELNVEDINDELLRTMKNNNVNRVSIGVQSFNDEITHYFNRNHKKEEAIKNIAMASKYFSNINIDLIYGSKLTSFSTIDYDIEQLKKLNISHVSIYSLQIEKNTMLYINKERPLDDETVADQYEYIVDKLASIGFNRYEISNFSKPGFESKHNLTYWHNEEYDSLGPGSSFYLNNTRGTYTRSVVDYIKNETIIYEEKITQKEDLEYYVYLNLRLEQGVDLEEIKNKFNIDFYEFYKEKLLDLEEKQLIIIKNNRFKCSCKGFFLQDFIINKIF